MASSTLALTTGVDSSAGKIDRPVLPGGIRGLVYSSSALELFWDRDSAHNLEYIILADDIEIGRSTGTSFYVMGLNAGETYDFSVSLAEPDTSGQTNRAQITLTTRQ